jgi:geranyl-CoA carboxylase alpha subunit
MRPLRKVLVANRGEIARRVLRAVRAEGLRGVAVYSDADRNAPHVLDADEAVHVGPAPPAASYADASRVLAAACASGADAVHPGYGFLSGSAPFARACTDAGLVYVGPGADTLELVGNKARAKKAVRLAGVPCVPGYAGDEQSDERLVAEARTLGFPLFVKAAAGAGGRGIRLVRDAPALEVELALARAEAAAVFGDETLLLERALLGARHVDVQILADVHGAVVHLGERDCSVQRRHQKVLAEAPSPTVDAGLRARLGEAAIAVVRACGYAGAGSVEFLVDTAGRFYFLEMNARIPVEHAVTEAVAGVDLVAWQLRIAAGQRLRLRQEDLHVDGHAIEARLYAEDPTRAFMPQSGVVRLWREPVGAGVRVEHALAAGEVVGRHYDALLATIAVHAPDRARARALLARALRETVVLGVATNKRFLRRLLDAPVVVEGRCGTDFLDRWREPPAAPAPVEWALAAVLWYGYGVARSDRPDELADWSNVPRPRYRMRLRAGTHVTEAALDRAGAAAGRHVVAIGAAEVALCAVEVDGARVVYEHEGRRRTAWFAFDGALLHLDTGDGAVQVVDDTFAPAPARAGSFDGRVLAPMCGAVAGLLVAPGDRVEPGQGLVVLESMKLLLTIVAEGPGTVARIAVAAGDAVRAEQVLVVLNPVEAEHVHG